MCLSNENDIEMTNRNRSIKDHPNDTRLNQQMRSELIMEWPMYIVKITVCLLMDAQIMHA